MLDVEQILRDEAAALEEAVSERPVPAFRPPRVRRWPKVVVPLAAAAVLIAVIAGVALTRADDDRRVATIPTPPPPPTSTEVLTTTVAPTTTVPPANPFPTGVPLETIAETGGPIALNPAPEGFLPYMAHASPSSPVGLIPGPRGEIPTPTDTQTWVAFDGDVPVADRNLTVSVGSLEPGDNPYSISELDQSPELQYGALFGKVGTNVWRGTWYFAGALSADSAVTVMGMGFDAAGFEEVLGGIEVSADLNVLPGHLPPDFRLVYDRIDDGLERYDHEYKVIYAKNSAMTGSIFVGLTTGQVRPAELALLHDQGTVLEFDGRYGVRTEDRVLIDLSPGIQVSISINWGFTGGGPPDSSSDYLIELARSVVALTSDEWASLQQYTSEHPFQPVDMPCSGGPITFSELVTDSPTLEPLGEFAVFGPGGTFSVTGQVEPPTELTINARNPRDGALIPLATALVDGPTPFTVTWDGTINGAAAPPGYYTLQVTGTFTADQNGGPCVTNYFEQGNLIKALYYIE